MPKPSLLFLAHDFPVPVEGSQRLRSFNWILHFSREFDITLVAPLSGHIDGLPREVLAPYCKEILLPPSGLDSGLPFRVAYHGMANWKHRVQGLPRLAVDLRSGPMNRALRQLSADQRFDVVFADHWAWGSDAIAMGDVSVVDWLPPRWAKAPEDVLSRNRLRRELIARSRTDYLRHAYSTLKKTGIILVRDPETKLEVSKRTQEHSRIVILQSGIDTAFFAPRKNAKDPRNIVFLGPLHSATQRDALYHFHSDLLPQIERRLGRVRLTVVDADPGEGLNSALIEDPRVKFTGRLSDTRFALWESGCAVLPLRLGRGDRDRLAQLLAMGIPTVATPLAARSMQIASGDGLIIAQDGADFANATLQVLNDPSLRRDLSARGRETAMMQLSMEATYERLTDVLSDAAAQAQTSL